MQWVWGHFLHWSPRSLTWVSTTAMLVISTSKVKFFIRKINEFAVDNELKDFFFEASIYYPWVTFFASGFFQSSGYPAPFWRLLRSVWFLLTGTQCSSSVPISREDRHSHLHSMHQWLLWYADCQSNVEIQDWLSSAPTSPLPLQSFPQRQRRELSCWKLLVAHRLHSRSSQASIEPSHSTITLWTTVPTLSTTNQETPNRSSGPALCGLFPLGQPFW